MREVVAVDMDDVVVETAAHIIQHVNTTYGVSMTIDRFYTREPEAWGAPDIETAVRRVNSFLETEEYFMSTPIQESITALRSIKKIHDLYIVTGRPDFTELATRKWLKSHMPDLFEDVVFTNYFDPNKVRTKGDVCRELGATVLIDDHIDHCISAQDRGIRPILFGRYPWNDVPAIPDGIERAEHWPMIEQLLIPNEK